MISYIYIYIYIYIYVGDRSASSVEILIPVSHMNAIQKLSCKFFFFGENQAMNSL